MMNRKWFFSRPDFFGFSLGFHVSDWVEYDNFTTASS